jgi:hypothetical protein
VAAVSSLLKLARQTGTVVGAARDMRRSPNRNGCIAQPTHTIEFFAILLQSFYSVVIAVPSASTSSK